MTFSSFQHESEDVQASNASDNDCSEEDSVVANKNGTALAMTAEPKKDNYKVRDFAFDTGQFEGSWKIPCFTPFGPNCGWCSV